MNETPKDSNQKEAEEKPGILKVFFSVAAAAFGVQNSKTRNRDFTQGNPVVFILAGLIFTILFVLTLLLIVSMVLG